MIELYPPLQQIEQRLFGLSDELLAQLAEQDPEVPKDIRAAALKDTEWAEKIENLRQTLVAADRVQPTPVDAMAPPPPAFIQTLIQHKVAATQADFGKSPAPSQIVRLDQLLMHDGSSADLAFSAPFAVLLDRQDSECADIWHGWLVASEIQYAGVWDFVLQAEDEPFDPACAVVQLWNPVQIFLPESLDVTVSGQLSAARMQALHAMVQEFLLEDAPDITARPGFIALRKTCHDMDVVTGTPLADPNDPRYAYQQSYHHFAHVLNQPALAWKAQQESEQQSLLSAITDVLAAAWEQATRYNPQIEAPVANPMSEYDDQASTIIVLREDLKLTLTETPAGLDITLTYSGEQSVSAELFADGRNVANRRLDANNCTLAYSGLSFEEENFLIIDAIKLPLTGAL